ncbi:hypothetical protein GQ53DRAFT_859696 [Thozetella sp. PMI_491]|nr:hypothetical protein GQ53DRAFT_859696 [Thozetella sp. PMI_491]
MCRHAIYKHHHCGCQWMQIIEGCHRGTGFDTCITFQGGPVKPPPPVLETARFQPCPRCDLGGNYDRNFVRMVLGIHHGIRVGTGPGRNDKGVEIRCLLM